MKIKLCKAVSLICAISLLMACAGSDPTNRAPGASSHSALLTRRQRLTGLAKIAVALHVSCDIIAVGPYRMVFFALPPLKICGQPNFG